MSDLGPGWDIHPVLDVPQVALSSLLDRRCDRGFECDSREVIEDWIRSERETILAADDPRMQRVLEQAAAA